MPWLYYGAGLLSIVLAVSTYYFWKLSELPTPSPAQGAGHNMSHETGTAPAAGESMTDTAAVAAPTKTAQPAVVPPSDTPPARPEPVAKAEKPAKRTAAATPKQPAIRIRKRQRTPPFAPVLQQAYEAYQHGEWKRASTLYRRVLARYPRNRDALLGLAAVALQTGDTNRAGHYYRKVLQLNPQDPIARAALANLSEHGDPLAAESRLKHWLDADPDNALLHFTLGNHYAKQDRWKEAQQSYFRAHQLEPDNADYAFNLGVSLDRLNKKALAVRYYRQALDSAAQGATAFDSRAIRVRIAALEQDLQETP